MLTTVMALPDTSEANHSCMLPDAVVVMSMSMMHTLFEVARELDVPATPVLVPDMGVAALSESPADPMTTRSMLVFAGADPQYHTEPVVPAAESKMIFHRARHVPAEGTLMRAEL